MKAFSKLRQCFKKHIDNIFFIFVLLLLVALAVALAVEVPENIVRCLRELLGLSKKDEILKFIGFCIAGVVSIWLAWAANKRAKAMEDTAREQANVTENTEEGQRQERLKNAIEHLGHKRDSVRMGGAYELFHLAKDTEGLRQTVLDILCAHIRQTTGENDYQAKHRTKPSEEIQSLLTLLFVQKHEVFEDCLINLQGSYLNGATLFQARLKRADLREARLQGAILWQAQMQEAILWQAQMQGATLWQALLHRAVLNYAQLQGAALWQAQMQGATLVRAQLQGVISHGAYPLPSTRFENKIRSRIGQPSDLTGIIFAGELQQEDLDALCEGLSDDQAQALREKLRLHVGKPANNELPKNSGAETGTYTQEKAEQWIAEYNKAMQEASSAGDR